MPPDSFNDSDPLLIEEICAYQARLDQGIVLPEGHSVTRQPIPPQLSSSLGDMQRCLKLLQQTRRHLASQPSSPSLLEDWKLGAALPEKIGRFEITARLGIGGFGIVYRAVDPATGRDLAVKIPRLEILGSPDLVLRFVQEAAAVAKLTHPNIVPIFESHPDDPVPYLVMPFIAGPTLAHWRNDQSHVPPRLAAGIVRQLAEALAHAHKKGILHRDIKPANVLLAPADPTRTEQAFPFIPQLTDFGLAKLRDANLQQLTNSGTILGTAAYLSPELAEGKLRDASPATDVYGLGVILYELLAGTSPFQAETSLQTLRKVSLEDPLPLERYVPEIPRDLELICLKCLRKNPLDRYQTAPQLANDLQNFLDGKPVRARPVSVWDRCRKWCRRNPGGTALIATTFLGLIALTTVSLYYNARLSTALEISTGNEAQARTRALEIRRRAAVSDVRLAQIAYDMGHVDQAVKLLKGCIPQPGEEDVRTFAWDYLWKLATQSPRQLATHTPGLTVVTVAPDGNVGASAGRDGVIRLWELPSGNLRDSFRDSPPKASIHALSISPDGRRLASLGSDGALRVRDLSHRKTNCLHVDTTRYVGEIAWSADGKLLASSTLSSVIRLWDGETGEPRGILESPQPGKPMTGLAFHPREALLISSSKEGTIRFWNLNTFKPDTRLPHGMITGNAAENGFERIAVSSDGTTLISGNKTHDLFQWSLKAEDFGHLVSRNSEPSHIQSICWPAHSGPLISYNETGIRIADPRKLSRNESQLTRDQRIIYSVAADANARLILSADASGAVKLWERTALPSLLSARESQLQSPEDRLAYHSLLWSPSVQALHISGRKIAEGAFTNSAQQADCYCLFQPSDREFRRCLPVVLELCKVELSPSGKYFVGYRSDGTAFCKTTHDLQDAWNILIPDFSSPPGGRKTINFLPDESQVLLSNKLDVVLLSLKTGKLLHRFTHQDPVVEVVVRTHVNQEKLAAVLCFSGILHVWNLVTGQEMHRFQVDDDARSISLAQSRNGKLLAAGNRRGEAVVRKWDDMTEVTRFTHAESVYKIAFWDQDRILLTIDQKLHFWGLEDGVEHLVIPAANPGYEGISNENRTWDRYVGIFSISPDGNTLAIPMRNDILFMNASPRPPVN